MLRMCEPPLKRGCGLLTAAVAAAAVGGGNVDARSAKIRAVFIIGATGTGKSKLGIQLAQKFGGEIVNADALQMYEGLDIATAKVTKEEMCGVPHHLMSFLGPTESWTVHKYRNAAREVIAEVAGRGKLPIVVGGTLYYVQSLLQPSLLDLEDEIVKEKDAAGGTGLQDTSEAFEGELYARLASVDPVMARRYHPHDLRKIARSLQVYEVTGVRHSDLLLRQKERLEGAEGSYECKLLWLDAERGVLNTRLDARVDKMLASGLLEEVRGLRARLEAGVPPQLPTAAPSPPPPPLSSVAIAATVCDHSPVSSAAIVGDPSPPPPPPPPPLSSTTLVGGVSPPPTQLLTSAAAAGDESLPTSSIVGSAPPPACIPSLPSSHAVHSPSSPHSGPRDVPPLRSVDDSEEQVGVLIAIGFKEFSSYFDVLDGVAPPPPPPPGSSKPNKQKKKGGPTRSPTELMLDSCVASLKLVTRKYARRQERWIKNRFVGRGFPVTRLDTTDLSRWDDLVLGPAEAAVSALVSGEGDHVTPVSDADRVHAWKKYSCDLCPGVLINGDLEWERHLKSKKHKRHARSASEGIKRSAPSCESSPPQSPSPEPDPKT